MAQATRIQQDIDALRRITEACEGGTTRVGYTPEYRAGAEYFKRQMALAGLTVREDTVGNVYGQRSGSQPGKGAIVSGSHLDTVRCAGAYDGIAGAVCALEVARMLGENGVSLAHPYEVMGIIEEEGTRFGQVLLGSKYAAGTFGEQDLDTIVDPDSGQSLRTILQTYRVPDAVPARREDSEIAAFLELHDEQGPLLEAEHTAIGIVERIVAISWLTVTVTGFAGHAGTVPMPLRQDAATGAARLIDHIAKFTTETFPRQATATVGKLQLLPGSANCIPSKCVFSVDLRSGEMAHIDTIAAEIVKQAEQIAADLQLDIRVVTDSRQNPVQLDAGLGCLLEQSCRKLGLTSLRMDSGAGHDAMIFAGRWPAAMLFVPCRRGITHNPLEYVSPEALAAGADVLYETVLSFDRIHSDRNI